MWPVVVMPDAELVAVTWLRAMLATRTEAYATGVTVGTRVAPEVKPDRFVRVRRVGGLAENLVTDVPRLDFLVWHRTDEERMQLAQLCRALMHSARGSVVLGSTVGRVEDVAGPVPLPDPADVTARICLFTVEVPLRGVPA